MTDITFQNVTKEYGSVVAINELDLTIPGQGIHALAGANGSGKTTILRLIAGLTDPTSGTLSRPNTDIGYAFQQPNVYPALSVRENINVFAGLTDARPPWIDHLLEELRLTHVADRPATDLSDGYRKKLDLAIAFAGEPSTVLLDEPLADIDDLTATNFITLLDNYVTTDRLVILATHNIERFARVIDRITIVHDGRVIETHTNPDDVVTIYQTTLQNLATTPD